MRNYLQLLTVLSIIAAASLGCSRITGGGGEVVYKATEVGEPIGDKAAKEIGPAGGTLSSPDGKLTLNVPQNALQETITFSIQPVTNKAANGIGNAYRLEPDGKTFPKPLEISFLYNDSDLEGTVPEAMSLAYQDKQGAWHAQTAAKLDQFARTITIETTHFTDYGNLARLKLIPPKATVRVGKAQIVQLLVCNEPGLLERIFSRPVACEDQGQQPPRGRQSWTLEGPGTIQGASSAQRQGMMFTTYVAPARKPNPNVAKVKLTAEFATWHPDTGETSIIQKTFESHITIVDSGYKATGSWGGMTFSGTVCSLEKPFTIVGQSQLTFNFKFTPASGGASGTVGLSGGGMGVTLHNGNGTYTVTGTDTDSPTIALTMGSFAGSYPGVGTAEGSGTRYVHLVPLETEECAGQN